MAKTLLNCVNEILKRTGVITGDAGELTTLTDSARQRVIDVAVQAVNEGIGELYRTQEMGALPQEQAESTITLVADDQDYALATDLVQLQWPFIDQTNNQYLLEYPGGYNQMIVDDPERDDTGLPHYAAIRPTDGLLWLDRAPTSIEAGRIYTYQYDKELLMTVLTDTVPFGDTVFTHMVPAWVQLWKREIRNEFDAELYVRNLATAADRTTLKLARRSYNPRG